MTNRLFLLLFLLVSSSALSCEAFTSAKDTLQGKVISIADGDTFTMLLDNKTTVKVRLASIDCPERKLTKRTPSGILSKPYSRHLGT
jgi:endonuclease YncB( thermonuclease family)